MAHRIWKETKQQPGTAGKGNMLGCCLVSFHFLWAILSSTSDDKPTIQCYNFHEQAQYIFELEGTFSSERVRGGKRTNIDALKRFAGRREEQTASKSSIPLLPPFLPPIDSLQSWSTTVWANSNPSSTLLTDSLKTRLAKCKSNSLDSDNRFFASSVHFLRTKGLIETSLPYIAPELGLFWVPRMPNS